MACCSVLKVVINDWNLVTVELLT